MDFRSASEHLNILLAFAGAVGTNSKEVLNFKFDDGPLGGVYRLFPATEIMVDECLVLFACFLAHGEHGVDEEDGGQELLVGSFYRLPNIFSIHERSHLWPHAQDWVFDCSASVAFSEKDVVKG